MKIEYKVGHTKLAEMKILKTIHRVTFKLFQRKFDLVKMLEDVPNDAKIVLIDQPDEKNEIIIIDFFTENEEIKGDKQ